MQLPRSSKSALRALPKASAYATARQARCCAARGFATSSKLQYFNYDQSHAAISKIKDTPNFIDNQFQPSAATEWFDIHDPATNKVVNRAPQSTNTELEAAVASAEQAYPAWKATSVLTRQSIMFKFVSLIKENWDRLATSITIE